MFTFHIYLGDTCIGDARGYSPDNALLVYALRTNSEIDGLTAVVIAPKGTYPSSWASI